MTIFRDNAPGYWAAGLPAIPLRHQSKAPAMAGWTTFGNRMPSEEEREDMLSCFPNGNVGLAFGQSSGLCAVDIDSTDPAQILAIEAALPPAPWRRVGKKGVALIYRNPNGVRNFSIPGLVDFLATGKQLVLPPSIHPDTGHAYSANSDLRDAATLKTLTEIPADVETRIRHALGMSDKKRPVGEGGRHLVLTSEAGRLRNKGLAGLDLRDALLDYNQRNFEPPLPVDEVEQIVAWADTIAGGDGLPLTELGNARRLVRLLDGSARFVREEKLWWSFDGTRWAADADGSVERMAKEVADGLLAGAGDDKERRAAARSAQSARGIRAMIELARTEPGVSISASSFDADRDMLNTPSGIVDLRTASLHPPARESLHSKLTAAPFIADAECPVLERVVAEVFPDEELARAFQRIIGYCFTGRTDEQKIIIASGSGANAKSMLMNLFAEVLGDYARHTPMATFLQRRSDAATNDLAALAGARLAIANEGNPGQKLDTALVKTMTGGDPITARRLYQDFLTFSPHHKPFLVSNHLPEIDGNDPAIWRRVMVIPFTRTFSEHEQDRLLPHKLRAELPGVLRWAIDGAVAYYREGLNLPEAILNATSAYRSEMDVVGAFISECCAVTPGATSRSMHLYLDYVSYARELGGEIITQTAFGRELGRRNFGSFKKDGVVWRRGLALKPQALGRAT